MAETMRSPTNSSVPFAPQRDLATGMVASGRSHKGFVALAGRSNHLRSPASTAHRPPRRYSWASTSVDDVRKVRKAFGAPSTTSCSPRPPAHSDSSCSAVASRGATGAQPGASLVRTATPAVGRSATAPWPTVSGMFADLPVGIEDPVERLAAVTSQMNYLKSSHEAVAAEALTSLGASRHRRPRPRRAVASKAPQRSYNTVTTNVPGPQQPLFVSAVRCSRCSPMCRSGSGPPRCGDLLLQRASQLGVTR